MRPITLQQGVQDVFLWKWTSDHCFSTASAYWAFFIGQHEIPGAKILHKSRAPGKCKFFLWLALHDRCWTAERRKRHNLQDDDSCALCDQESESIDHLLLGCSFARELWFNILLRLRWHFLTPGNLDESLADWWSRSRKRLQKADRKCFDSLVILTSWMIWKERNARIFDSKQLTVAELLLRVKEEADVWLLAGFKQIGAFPAAFGAPFDRRLLSL